MLPGFFARAKAAASFLTFAGDRAGDQELPMRAAALSFDSILCAAPLATLAVGLAGAFPEAAKGFSASLQPVMAHLLPASLDDALNALRTFSGNAASLGAISLVAAIVSGANLSVRLEECLAVAWGEPAAKDVRSMRNRFERHWIAITLFPVLAAIFGWIAASMASANESWGATLLGPLFLAAAFLALFRALPQRKPPWKPAIAAAAASAAAGLVLQVLFEWAWRHAASYGVVYGAAAGVVGLVLWIWLFWTAVLYPPSLAASWTAWIRRIRSSSAAPLGEDAAGDSAAAWSEPDLPESFGVPSPSLEACMLALDHAAQLRGEAFRQNYSKRLARSCQAGISPWAAACDSFGQALLDERLLDGEVDEPVEKRSETE